MFKRFLVMDLFEKLDDWNDKKDDLENKKWVSVTDRLPEKRVGIFKVLLSNGIEKIAYFCADQCTSLISPDMGINKSYWWDKTTKEPIYDVTHYKERYE